MLSLRLITGILLCLVSAVTCASAVPESLGSEGGKGDWDIQFRPYVWTADISGDVGVGPLETDVDVDFDDIFSSLDGTWASTIDVRRRGGKWSFFLDTFYLRLDPDTGPAIKEVTIEQAILDGWVGYRLYESEETWFEISGGLRWFYLKNEIDLNAGPKFGKSTDWFDPHGGFRFKHYFTDKFYTGGGADIGGFGVGSELTWQTAIVFGYHLRENLALEFVYRHLSVDYDDDILYDTDTDGLLLGVALYF